MLRMPTVVILIETPYMSRAAPFVFCAAVPGTTAPGALVVLVAATATPAFAAPPWVCA